MSKRLTALGLMSGTSLDGIDVAMVVTDGEDDVARGPSRTYPYRPDQQAMLREALQAASSLTDRTARPGILADAERDLTDWHREAVENFCRDEAVALSGVDLVGFHGQTVVHRPDRRLTVQIGDGGALARSIGRPVVHDLRAADVAAGGQGAPLVPVYHRALASALTERPVAFVNIGGVANMTWIGRDGDIVAFDTGPGNALLDDWCTRHLGEPFDRDGKLAAAGTLNARAFLVLAQHPYFARKAPKSLDRNSFDVSALEGLSAPDGAATLAHFTATSIARAAAHVPAPPVHYVITGGGRRNTFLMRLLKDLLEPVGARMELAEDIGFNGDSMEAEAWAYLAVRSWRGLPITYPGTTGCREPLTAGVITHP